MSPHQFTTPTVIYLGSAHGGAPALGSASPAKQAPLSGVASQR